MATVFTCDAPIMQRTKRGVAWSTKLYVAGILVANVKNDGDGGCDHYSWLDRDFEQQFHDATTEWIKNNPTIAWKTPEGWEVYPGYLRPDYCSQYMEHLLSQAEKGL